MEKLAIDVKKLNENAKTPHFAHDDDAGMDLFAAEEVTIAPGESATIPTGIAMAIPLGYVGLIWDKSGHAIVRGLKVMGGVVDAGYRGEIKIGIINHGKEPHTFEAGDKVAQMLLQKVSQATFTEVDELSETVRGEGGFGSTGK